MQQQLSMVDLSSIQVSKTAAQVQRRKYFQKAELAELSESIKSHGVLQPIIVRPVAKGSEVVAGERRYLAAKLAGLNEIPAISKALSDEGVLEVQLIENLQRADLHPMEEAEGYQELMAKHKHPIEDIYSKVGKSRSYVYSRLKLLELSKPARKAFYEGKISASVGLLIARIPSEKLQNEALKNITRTTISYRRAKDIVQTNYMLRLSNNYFPKNDAKLLPKIGACGPCPKRTGNAPDLFGDVKGTDVCTDPICFKNKTVANSARLLAEAEASGKKVIKGNPAKKAWQYGEKPDDGHIQGYSRLTHKDYRDTRNRTVRQILGKDLDPVLLQNPRSGVVIEVVPDAVVSAALRKNKPGKNKSVNPATTAATKAKNERKFRNTVYEKLRPKLGAPSLVLIAQALWREMTHDTIKIVTVLQGWEPIKQRYGTDYRGLSKNIAKLRGKALHAFINDCIYARDLQVNTYSNDKAENLMAAAKKNGVSPTTIRRQMVAKKKKKKVTKKARKKTTKRKKS